MPRTNAAAAVPVADLAAGETGLSGWVIEAQSIGSRLLEDGPVGEGPMGEWSAEGVPIGEGPMGEGPAGEGKDAGTFVAVESMLRGDISRVSVTLLACRYRCAQGVACQTRLHGMWPYQMLGLHTIMCVHAPGHIRHIHTSAHVELDQVINMTRSSICSSCNVGKRYLAECGNAPCMGST